MLNRDEWRIMQQQFVSMSDEKNQMIAQIQRLKLQNEKIQQQQHLVQRCRILLHEEIQSNNSKTNKLTLKIEKLKQKIQDFDDPNHKLKFDEIRLAKKELKLKKLIDSSCYMDDTIEQMKDLITQLQRKDIYLYNEIENAVNPTLEKYQYAIKSKPFRYLVFMVNDIESQYTSLKNIIRQHKDRISQLNQSSIRYSDENIQIEQDIITKDIQIQNLLAEIESLNPLFDQVNGELNEFKLEYNDNKNKLNQQLEIITQDQMQMTNLLTRERHKMDRKESKNNNLEADIDELVVRISQRESECKLIRKKQDNMMIELQKSIKQAIIDVTKSRSETTYMRRVIQTQENLWEERQVIYEKYKLKFHKHSRLAKIVDHKAKSLDVLIDWIKTVPPTNTKDPLTQFNSVYDFAVQENKSLGNSIALATKEIKQLEDEKKELEEKLTQKCL